MLERDPSPARSAALAATQVQSAQGDSNRSTPRQLTPSSTNSRSEPAGFPGRLDFDPDVPIPSIEREPGEATCLDAPNNSSQRARTPSFSITPPTTEGFATPIPSIATSYGPSPTPSSTVPSLTERIGDLELSGEPARRRAPFSELKSPSRGGEARSLTASVDDQHSTRSSVDNVTHTMGNIRLGTEITQPDSHTPGTYLHPRSPSPNIPIGGANSTPRSVSRRRSSSYVDPTPHNVAGEEPPRERFHEPEFQREFTNALSLVTDLAKVLASSSLHNEPSSRIRTLYLQAVELSRFQKPATHTVGLVGDSGVGKSSLLNSLLDFDGFARSSNSGAACTCVATEYHYHEHDDFAIEMEYFTLDELHNQLRELLQSYRHYHLHTIHDNDVQGEERKDLEEKAEVAHDTFLAAFRNHLMQNERFLLDNPEATVLQTLLTWARNSGLSLMESVGTGPEREFFDDARRCSDRLSELTSEPSSSNEVSAWPFIRKIKVYLNAYILSKGLVLVDLPGLRDLNSARLKITERYLLNCDEIFATCYIGRATTDAGVMGVFELARRASLSRIGIICTKSDDILEKESHRDLDDDARIAIRNLNRGIDETERDLEANEEKIREFTADSDTDTDIDDGEAAKLWRLQKISRKLEKRIETQRFELKSVFIDARNRKVTAALRTSYQSQICGGNLPIFCVSNYHYWEHRRKPKVEAMPFLHLSGILQVRKYCLSIVAESQLQAAIEHMTDAIPALLGSVELWVQSGAGSLSAERKQAVRNTLEEIEHALDTLKSPASPINATAQSMKQQFRTQIARTMGEYTDDWSKAALDATMEWQGWHHASYRAFCGNYGDHYTNAVGRHRCWNDEAMQAMVTRLATPWRTFQQNLQGLQEDLLSAIDDCFNCAIALSDSKDAATGSLRTLSVTMRHRQALLISAVEKLEEDFRDNIFILRTDAFSGIRSSFIGQLMEPSYNMSINQAGNGSDMRRKRIIRDGFGDERLFENHRRKFERKFSDLARDLQDRIQEEIATHLAVVQTDLDTLKNANVALESERHPEFRRRLEEAVHNVRQRMEDVYSVVSPLRTPTA